MDQPLETPSNKGVYYDLNDSSYIDIRKVSGIESGLVWVTHLDGPGDLYCSTSKDRKYDVLKVASGQSVSLTWYELYMWGHCRVFISRDEPAPPIPVERLDKLPAPYFYRMNAADKLEIAKGEATDPDKFRGENEPSRTVLEIGSISTDHFNFWEGMGGMRYRHPNGIEYHAVRASPAGDGKSIVFGNYLAKSGNILASSQEGITQLRLRSDPDADDNLLKYIYFGEDGKGQPTGETRAEPADRWIWRVDGSKDGEVLMRNITFYLAKDAHDVPYNMMVYQLNPETGDEDLIYSLQNIDMWKMGEHEPDKHHITALRGRLLMTPDIPMPLLKDAKLVIVVETRKPLCVVEYDDPEYGWTPQGHISGAMIERSKTVSYIQGKYTDINAGESKDLRFCSTGPDDTVYYSNGYEWVALGGGKPPEPVKQKPLYTFNSPNGTLLSLTRAQDYGQLHRSKVPAITASTYPDGTGISLGNGILENESGQTTLITNGLGVKQVRVDMDVAEEVAGPTTEPRGNERMLLSELGYDLQSMQRSFMYKGLKIFSADIAPSMETQYMYQITTDDNILFYCDVSQEEWDANDFTNAPKLQIARVTPNTWVEMFLAAPFLIQKTVAYRVNIKVKAPFDVMSDAAMKPGLFTYSLVTESTNVTSLRLTAAEIENLDSRKLVVPTMATITPAVGNQEIGLWDGNKWLNISKACDVVTPPEPIFVPDQTLQYPDFFARALNGWADSGTQATAGTGAWFWLPWTSKDFSREILTEYKTGGALSGGDCVYQKTWTDNNMQLNLYQGTWRVRMTMPIYMVNKCSDEIIPPRLWVGYPKGASKSWTAQSSVCFNRDNFSSNYELDVVFKLTDRAPLSVGLLVYRARMMVGPWELKVWRVDSSTPETPQYENLNLHATLTNKV